MFRPKKYVKLESLSSTPSIDDLGRVLAQVQKIRGCTIELPWHMTAANAWFALAVRIELGAQEPIWTLYEGDGLKSHAIWSAPFNDMSLLMEVISLSVAETIHEDAPGPLNSGPPTIGSSSISQSDYSNSTSKAETNYLISSLSENKASADIEQAKTEQLDKLENLQQDKREQHSYRHTEDHLGELISQQNSSQTESPVNPYASQDIFQQGQNYYPNANLNPNDSGRFPTLQQGTNEAAITYAYFYPGYPYPIPFPYPPGAPMAQPMATSIPLQPGTPMPDPNVSSSRMPAPDIELLRKQTNFMLGQFLVESGLIPEPTLKAALKLQEMVVGNVISKGQAIETVNRIHHQGGSLDIVQLMRNSPTDGNKAALPKQSYPLLGDLLVKAEIIDYSILQALLKMQEIVRSGALSKDEACQAINKELISSASEKHKTTKSGSVKEQRIVDLLIKCGLISTKDRDVAYSVQKKHGGKIDQILVAAGKLSEKTYQAAVECELLLYQEKIKVEQAIIALNYCERSRVSITDALEELNFRTDL